MRGEEADDANWNEEEDDERVRKELGNVPPNHTDESPLGELALSAKCTIYSVSHRSACCEKRTFRILIPRTKTYTAWDGGIRKWFQTPSKS